MRDRQISDFIRSYRNSPIYYSLLWNEYKKSKGLSDTNKISVPRRANPNKKLKIVVVLRNNESNFFKPLTGSYMLEIAKCLEEFNSSYEVRIFHCTDYINDWKIELKEFLVSNEIDVLIINPESDPDLSGNWTWDNFYLSLANLWNGFSIMILYDSVYVTHIHRVNHLLHLGISGVVIPIDRDIKKFIKFRRKAYGPYPLPFSFKSVEKIQSLIEHQRESKKIEFTFFGTLYPHREKQLQKLIDRGLPISIASLSNLNYQPTYEEFFIKLINSKFTINLSRPSRPRSPKHHKLRVIEALLADVFVLSDYYKLDKKILDVHQQILPLNLNLKSLKLKENKLNKLHIEDKLRISQMMIIKIDDLISKAFSRK